MASSSYSELVKDTRYDVFLSFRGLDTRKNFTHHLYEALNRNGFRTFRDDDDIERGTVIKSELQKAIRNSRTSIIVLSKNYASSTSCLFEIQTILQHRKKSSDHFILPVFYEVDPSEITKQAEKLGGFFQKNKVTVEEVKGWSAALKEIASVAGMVSKNQSNGYEAKFIEEIVGVLKSKLSGPGPNIIPDDFRCPISLELMRDPVIVSTGQTYERSCIEKWLDAGHGTCPKTQQVLTNAGCTALTPNYVLRGLIAQWCEENGIESRQRESSLPNKSGLALSSAERTKIGTSMQKLISGNPEDQRYAAGDIRLLAFCNANIRAAIAEAGAIPLLVDLLFTPDLRTQEHAVTALFNLSIFDDNKGSIITSGALPGVVHVLEKGTMEARENAAATLHSLSIPNENRVTIGGSGAIPQLVTLLREGTQRGKKDAAKALSILCTYQGSKVTQGNKVIIEKALRAGIVPPLIRLLTEPQGEVAYGGLIALWALSFDTDGLKAVGAAEAVSVLVEVIGSGSPKNKEWAAIVLEKLCRGDQKYLVEALELGVIGLLIDLAQNGTDKGKRKACQLLKRMIN